MGDATRGLVERAAGTVDVERLRALLPQLGTAGLESAAASERALRGKVLKLKLGFNPNSSSVGTTVVVFLWTLVASGAVTAMVTAVLAHRFMRRRERGESAAGVAGAR